MTSQLNTVYHVCITSLKVIEIYIVTRFQNIFTRNLNCVVFSRVGIFTRCNDGTLYYTYDTPSSTRTHTHTRRAQRTRHTVIFLIYIIIIRKKHTCSNDKSRHQRARAIALITYARSLRVPGIPDIVFVFLFFYSVLISKHPPEVYFSRKKPEQRSGRGGVGGHVKTHKFTIYTYISHMGTRNAGDCGRRFSRFLPSATRRIIAVFLFIIRPEHSTTIKKNKKKKNTRTPPHTTRPRTGPATHRPS